MPGSLPVELLRHSGETGTPSDLLARNSPGCVARNSSARKVLPLNLFGVYPSACLARTAHSFGVYPSACETCTYVLLVFKRLHPVRCCMAFANMQVLHS